MSDNIKPVSEMPAQRGLLPNEVAIQIGCVGCTGLEQAGCSVISADRPTRDRFVSDLMLASGLSGVPVQAHTSVRVYESGVETPDGCDGSRPCADSDNQDYFNIAFSALNPA